MLDLQLVRRANPSVDISYLLGSSTSPQQREKHLDEWLQHYWTKLDGYMVSHGHPKNTYPFDALKKDMQRTFLFGIVLGAMHAMVIVSPARCV